MKFLVVLTVLPALCIPVFGSPLRGPSETLFSIDPESRPGPVAPDLTTPSSVDGFRFAPDTGFFTDEPFAFSDPRTITSGLDPNATFGPPKALAPLRIQPISRPVMALLDVSSLLDQNAPAGLLFLIAGIVCLMIALLRSLRSLFTASLIWLFRKLEHPYRHRIHTRERMMSA